MTSQELVESQRDLVAFVDEDKFRDELEQVLPPNVPVAVFVRGFKNAALANPDIIKADRRSLYLALLRAASAELIPDGREGAIVVYKDKAQFIPMIGGIRKVLAEFGWSLRTSTVYENDVFEYDESQATVEHKPPRLGNDRGEMRGAYALAVHRDGRRELVVYSMAQIEDVRKKSSRSDKVWKDWPDRMAEKTPAHRLAKKLPLASQDRVRLENLLAVDEMNGDEAAALLYGNAPVEPIPDEADDAVIVTEGDIEIEREAGSSEGADGDERADEGESAEGEERTAVADESAVSTERVVPVESAEQTERAVPQESTDAHERPYEGEEPPLQRPTFGYGRYADLTVEEVYDLGDEGLQYLRWAFSRWKTGPVVDVLQAFAETHPEIKVTNEAAARERNP